MVSRILQIFGRIICAILATTGVISAWVGYGIPLERYLIRPYFSDHHSLGIFLAHIPLCLALAVTVESVLRGLASHPVTQLRICAACASLLGCIGYYAFGSNYVHIIEVWISNPGWIVNNWNILWLIGFCLIFLIRLQNYLINKRDNSDLMIAALMLWSMGVLGRASIGSHFFTILDWVSMFVLAPLWLMAPYWFTSSPHPVWVMFQALSWIPLWFLAFQWSSTSELLYHLWNRSWGEVGYEMVFSFHSLLQVVFMLSIFFAGRLWEMLIISTRSLYRSTIAAP